MVATPQINAPQGGETVVYKPAPTPALRAPSAGARAIYNVPSPNMKATGALFNISFRRISQKMETTQGGVIAISKGRIANPRVRAWTFTLDGHDFYVLRLGDTTTLLYDTATEQWTEWTYADLPFWRPNTGMTWVGSEGLAHQYGSSIVIGDDTFGLLWFLDPNEAFDEHPNPANPKQQIPFPRIVTGQVLAKGRNNVPCYAIFVDGDNYGLTADDFVPSVTLETSDDQGRTFDTHDTLTVTPDYRQDNAYEWLSLGQISSPGRLFRLTDNGVFARLDSMEMNDNAG